MIRWEPPPLPGAPPYVIWTIGLGIIVVALLILGCIAAIALWLRDEARAEGRSPGLWFALGLIGGWITAVVWLVVRDRDDGASRALALLEEKKQPERRPEL